MAKRSKKYRAALEKVVANKEYPLGEAIKLAKEVSYAGFDETFEIAMRLGVNPKYADQMIRGTLVLPHGTGRSKWRSLLPVKSRRKRKLPAQTRSVVKR